MNLESLFEYDYVLLHHSALATAGCDSVWASRSSARVEERLNSYLDPPPPLITPSHKQAYTFSIVRPLDCGGRNDRSFPSVGRTTKKCARDLS